MARLLLFDIDMTLVRTTGAGRRALSTALERLYGVADATSGVHFDGRTDFAIFNEILERVGRAEPGEYGRLSEAYLEELPSGLKLAEGATVLPGVVDLLEALRGSHRLVGLGTGNMRAGAKRKLDHFGLWDEFAGGGFGDNSGVRAEILLAGIDELSAALGIEAVAADCIIIGDTPLDIAAAHAAGARALAVATGSYDIGALQEADAEWVLPDLSNLDLVMALLSS